MFLISNEPANTILTPIVESLMDETPQEVEAFIRTLFQEEWFDTSTASEKGNDNRLAHRIRSIRNRILKG